MCLVGSGAVNGSSTGAGSGACSGVGISSRFFIGNILLLKLLRIVSLVPQNNPTFFEKDYFSTCFTPLFIFFNSFTNLLYSLSASSNFNFLSNISRF